MQRANKGPKPPIQTITNSSPFLNTPPSRLQRAPGHLLQLSTSKDGPAGPPAYLGRLEAHACPLGGGKVHGFRDAVAAAHFGHKGSWEADDELATLLHGPVHLDPLFAQHLWGDLGREAGVRCTARGLHAQSLSLHGS